jgi:HlyD family secretion protein
MTSNSFDSANPLGAATTENSSDPLPSFKTQRSNQWLLGLGFFLLITTGGYLVLRNLANSQSSSSQRPSPVPIEQTNLTITVSANGTVEPEQLVNVSPKTAGILKTLLVAEGDSVVKGQKLAQMDDSGLQGQLIESKGRLSQAIANLNQKIAGNRPQEISQAQARLEELKANLNQKIAGNRPQEISQAQARLNGAQVSYEKAEDELNRYKLLSDEGAIAIQTLKEKQTNRDVTKASVTEAQEALDLLKIGTRQEEIDQARAELKRQAEALDLLKAGTRQEEIDQARAAFVSAKGSLQTIQTQIQDTVIRAPFKGIISRKYADPGAFVTPTTAGSSVSSATSSSILSLASRNRVVANVSENNIAKIRVGQSVLITADAYPGKTFKGKVSQIATQASVEQNVTSFEVKIALAENAAQQLRSGMNVSVVFQVGVLKNVLVVPTISINHQNNTTGVFIGVPGQAPKFVPITTGTTINNRTEVKSGLTGSEHILLNISSSQLPPKSGFSWQSLFGSSSKDRPPVPPSGGPPPL